MKKIAIFGTFAIAMLACIGFTSCSKEVNENPEPETYTVNLGWAGEIIDVSYEPLTRATTDDLYGIQVYYSPNKEESYWSDYAYGLFDDPENISINLMKGYKYKFVATMVKDGKNKVKSTVSGNYYYPFFQRSSSEGDISTRLNNTFDYQGDSYFLHMDSGMTTLESGSYYRPNVERFYGELEDYVPSQSGDKAIINMKRTCFGAKFIVSGALANEGTLHIQMSEAPGIELELTDGEDQIFDIYTFMYVKQAWLNDQYGEPLDVTISLERLDGTILPLGTHRIVCKRNKTTVVNVKIDNDGQTGGIGFEFEDDEIGIPEDDEEVTIEDGEIVETEIDSN